MPAPGSGAANTLISPSTCRAIAWNGAAVIPIDVADIPVEHRFAGCSPVTAEDGHLDVGQKPGFSVCGPADHDTVNTSQMLGRFGTGGNATIDGDRKLRIALLTVCLIVGQRRNFPVFLWAEPM